MNVANVVLKVPDGTPSVAGAVVDASGAPVPFAYIDLTPLDDQGPGQQERADAAGKFSVYDAPPGRYKLVATAAGAGITSDVVVAPRAPASSTGTFLKSRETKSRAAASFPLLRFSA